jgi:4-hydroxy-tetrahydrodipicolinate synthase
MSTPHPLPRGIVTPLVTFLADSGGPDVASMRALVDYQIDNGIHGLLAVGSTGELGNLTEDQRVETIEIVVAAAAGRVPVWAGVVGQGTTDAVIAARRAVGAGADALLVLPPMFFDSSDAELERHFSLVHEAVDVPLVAYDVPPRTPRKIPGAVIASLAAKGVLQGVKDSSGDLTAGRLTVELTRDIEGFLAYVGSEITLDAAFTLGFDGIVPGFANVLPRPSVDVFEAYDRGDRAAAFAAQRQYLDLFEVLRVALPGAGGPAAAVNALKIGAAHALGLATPRISEPMTQPTTEFVERVTGIVARLTTVRA